MAHRPNTRPQSPTDADIERLLARLGVVNGQQNCTDQVFDMDEITFDRHTIWIEHHSVHRRLQRNCFTHRERWNDVDGPWKNLRGTAYESRDLFRERHAVSDGHTFDFQPRPRHRNGGVSSFQLM